MNPKPYVQLQSIAVLLVTVITLGLLGGEVALTVAVALSVGTAIWAYFGLRYRWLRSGSGRNRSENRAGKDAAMLACFAVGLLLPGALAWCEVAVGGVEVIEPPVHGGQAVIMALSVMMIPLSILVSSSVDWYLIRPFREGVHDDPVCQSKHEETSRTMDYARYWIMHGWCRSSWCTPRSSASSWSQRSSAKRLTQRLARTSLIWPAS